MRVYVHFDEWVRRILMFVLYRGHAAGIQCFIHTCRYNGVLTVGFCFIFI